MIGFLTSIRVRQMTLHILGSVTPYYARISWVRCLLLIFTYLVSGGYAAADDEKFAPVMSIIKTCETCHGEGGNSTIATNPTLSGQHFYYTYVQLKDFKAKRRDNPIMSPLAATLDKDQMKLIAEYFSKQEWPAREAAVDDETTVAAKKVINAGQCVACHLGGFEGDSRVPRTNGQYAEYLQKTMLDFKTKSRNNSPSKGSLIGSFSDEELIAVAKYLASLNQPE